MSVVKLQVKQTGKEYKSYIITLPKRLVEEILQWKKGDTLIIEYKEVDGRKGLFITKT